jgi:hypothetical protein
MSRIALGSLPVLVVLVLGERTTAQSLPPHDPTGGGPLGSKTLAKERRAADRAQPADLKRALEDTARSEYLFRVQQVRSGAQTPDVLLGPSSRLLSASLALPEDQSGHLAALVRHWAVLWGQEELTRERLEAVVKNFSPADYWEARGERLLAEWQLVGAMGATGKPWPGAALSRPDAPDPLASRAAARAAFEATRTPPEVLAQAALDATLSEYAIRQQMIAVGVPGPVYLVSRRAAAERGRGKDPAELLPALEGLWQLNWFNEQRTRDYLEQGNKLFTPADYDAVHAARLAAAVWVAEARSRDRKLLPLRGGLPDAFAGVDDPLQTRRLAQAKLGDTRPGRRQLAENMRDALRSEYDFRLRLMRGGLGILDYANVVLWRLINADQDLAVGRAEHLAVLERYWALARSVEELTSVRVEAGTQRLTPADFLEAHFSRLQAELWIAEARAGKGVLLRVTP